MMKTIMNWLRRSGEREKLVEPRRHGGTEAEREKGREGEREQGLSGTQVENLRHSRLQICATSGRHWIAGIALVCAMAAPVWGQSPDAISVSEPFISERGPHHRTWMKTVTVPGADGRTVSETRTAYIELGTGMHYRDPNKPDDPNAWLESSEEFELFEGGAIARKGQHQLILSPSIADIPAIDMQVGGTRLATRIFGLAYYCAATGRSVLLAEIKEAVGELTAPNTIIYRDCFTDDIKADVRCVYRLSGIEVDVILRQQLPDPREWNIDAQHCRVQVWTAFLDPPAANTRKSIIRSEANPIVRAAMHDPDFSDELIAFPDVHFTRGKAFTIEGEAVEAAGVDVESAVPVGKQYAVVDQVQYLIESCEYGSIKPLLDTLPVAGNGGADNKGLAGGISTEGSKGSEGGTLAGTKRGGEREKGREGEREQGLLTQRRGEAETQRNPLTEGSKETTKKRKVFASAKEMVASGKKPVEKRAERSEKKAIAVAKAAPERRPGLVIDWVSVNGSLTNYVFEPQNTYYISGLTYLYGATNSAMGNCVVKFAPTNTAKIDVQGNLIFETDIYRPFVLTARDDHTQGEAIGGGGSLSGVYADTALRFDYNTSSQLASVTNLKVMYARRGLEFAGGHGHDVRHVQWVNCGTALHVDAGTVGVRNALGWNLTNVLVGASSSTSTGIWEHATFNQATNLVTTATGAFTNCLLVSVVSTNGLSGSPNSVAASSNGVFAAVGGGSHYLADDTYRNIGATNQGQLAREIAQRTTYKPLVVTNTIAVNTTLSPQAGRDTDTPDMGWHYAPLDWWACGVTVNSNVTLLLTNSVAVGMDYVSNSWGFILKSGTLVSVGTPTAMNRLLRADTAQEKSGGNPGTRACFYDGSTVGSVLSELRLRFTEFSQLAQGGYMIYVGTKFRNIEWSHCRFFNPLIVVSASGTALTVGITNNLFERADINFTANPPGTTLVHMRNNLFHHRVLHLTGTNTWTIRDNLFDSLFSLTDNGKAVQNSYNGYFNTTWGLSGGSNNTNLTSLSYQVGPLGNAYQPTNSVLINLGSQNATNAGLYHWCVTTNSVKETNSVVDIGLHYVAVDASGQPQDTDSDGVPDYLEDANGNGAVNSSETDWQNAGDSGLRVFITRPREGSNVP